MLKLVDELGRLKAEIASLQLREAEIETLLVTHGAGAYEGKLFRATVSIYPQERTAWKEVAEKFNPSRQLIRAHSTTITVTAVRVVSRSNDKAEQRELAERKAA